MSEPLNDILNQLGLIESNAIFFREEKDGQVFNGFSSELQKKMDIIKPDAYFIFNKQPFVLFFDLSDNENFERESDIHKQVWSFDQAPVIFVIKNTEIKVFNAFRYTKEQGLEEIELSKEERNERFSFWNLQSGDIWKNWFQKEYFEKTRKAKTSKRANQLLFENIKQVRKSLVENGVDEDKGNTLILRLIFIRYLIDRGVSIDEKFISGGNTIEKRLSFCKLIEDPFLLNQLFDKLNIKFNGVLFKDIDVILDQAQSKSLAQIFNGEILDPNSLFYGFDFYFEIFDFSIIPVEVISGIYESLIDRETRELDSAVYTPAFLVEFILNDTVEKFLDNNNTAECRVFDPAVGSGIFLVQSLRKMIDKEIQLNKNLTKSEFSERIREIAKTNLFGIDINLQALKVTCFSIYIALLDYQEPKDIDQYEFPNLINENLFEANFFDDDDGNPFNQIILRQNLDFILGNPPWKSNKDETHLNWLKKHKKVTGNFEIAQSFLLRSKDFMQPETRTALIVTSTIFYNVAKTTKEFKKDFLTTFCIEKFFDLSPVRRLIFEEKNSPASIVYYRLSKENEYLKNSIKHQSVKSNRFLKHYKMLVIEKYDQKEILQRHFIENDWMFKVALYGNTLDFHLIKRLLKASSTKISGHIDNINLFGGAGFHKGTPEKYKPFIPLLDKPLIENSEIQKYYSISCSNRTVQKSDIYIKSGQEKGLYEGTQILIKEQAKDESEIVISLVNKEYAFHSGVFTITSFNDHTKILTFYSILISNIYSYFIYLSSGSWGTSTRPQIRWKEEFLAFPFIKPTEKKKRVLIDLVNQFLNPFKDHYKHFNLGEPHIDKVTLNKINNEINELYGVSGYEIDLIDYVLEVSRYQFQESKQDKFTRPVHSDLRFLERYANVYIDEFSKIYPDEYLQIEVYPLKHFIAMNFVFQKTKPEDENRISFPNDKKDEAEILKRLANNLTISQITNTENPEQNLFIQKDIKGFEENSFYIIKPNEFKCWHRAMAWYDVAEFKETIETAELNHLNEKIDGK